MEANKLFRLIIIPVFFSFFWGCASNTELSKEGIKYQKIRFMTSDQGMVYADIYGLEGPRKFGVVLAHDSHNDKGDWGTLIQPLLLDGGVVMALNFRGTGQSIPGSMGTGRMDFDLLAACYYLKITLGIKPVSVVGSGMGGLAALTAASTRYMIDSMVLISPDPTFSSLKNIQCPILFIVSEHDEAFLSTKAMYARNPSKSQFEVVPGIASGQYLLDSSSAPEIIKLIRKFYHEKGHSLYFPGVIYE
ncbi:MAG: alpha/beta hydrolase [bacterium]